VSTRRPDNKKRDRDSDEPLQRQIETIRRRVQDLEDDGPTPDAKALRVRFENMERRLQELERMSQALLDIAEVVLDQATAHLAVRHEVADNDTRSADMIHVNRIRSKLQTLRKQKPRTPEAAPNVQSAPSVQK
jgi:hypothetical protein